MPTLNVKPHPFKNERFTVEVEDCDSLFDLLPANHSHLFVALNGETVIEDQALKASDVIDIAVVPTGTGDRQQNTQKAISTGAILLIGALSGGLTAAPDLAYLGLKGWRAGAVKGALAAAVATGLSRAANEITPKPSMRKREEFNRLGSLTGVQNKINQYGVIPKVYGHRKIFPSIAGKPYTEIIGGEQYIRVMYCLGYGPININETKIDQCQQ